MGNKQSRDLDPEAVATDNGQPQLRAIARGRVYVVINYPRGVHDLDTTRFNDDQFRQLLADLQKNFPEFEVTLDAGQVERFQEHAMFYSSSDPDKFTYKPRVLIEVFYTGVYGGFNKEMLRRTVGEQLDPESHCHIDLRSEMGRYHTTPHLETLLRI